MKLVPVFIALRKDLLLSCHRIRSHMRLMNLEVIRLCQHCQLRFQRLWWNRNVQDAFTAEAIRQTEYDPIRLHYVVKQQSVVWALPTFVGMLLGALHPS